MGRSEREDPGRHEQILAPKSGLPFWEKSLRDQERNEAKRAVWRKQTRGVDLERFVWIDETGSHLGMTRRYSRAPRASERTGRPQPHAGRTAP